ncbi:2-dehydro-3-deoxygalactonokinase [Rhizobium sp. PAMB 3182]
MMNVDWIAADWGTTNLRVWAIGKDGAVLDQASSNKGMGSLKRDEFEGALLEVVGPWLTDGKRLPVIACGMVGARQGWLEAPYAKVPCPPLHADSMVAVPVKDPRIAVSIIPGLCQMQPADVMRGEETQIAGYLFDKPDFDGVLCLPGTHTKWAQISAGEVVSFRTFMSGELFSLISTQSVLRHSIPADGWHEDAFAAAVDDAMSKPEAVASRLFSLRAESLLTEADPAAARARLSGLLIGMELAASKPYWLGQNIAIIGARALSDLYARALSAQGCRPVIADNDTLTLGGLKAARAQMEKDKAQ